MASVTVGSPSSDVARRPRPSSPTATVTGGVAGHLQAYDGPDRRLRPLADDVGKALHEVVGGVDGRRGVEVARHPERAAHVLLVHPHVERAVAQQQPGRPADGAEGAGCGRRGVGGRVGQQLGVAGRRRLADLGDEVVGRLVATGQHALLGEPAHHPARVRRLADLDLLVRTPGQQRLEVGGVGGDGPDVPAGQVGRGGPLVVGDVLEHLGEGVDGAPPERDEGGQPLPVRRGLGLGAGRGAGRGIAHGERVGDGRRPPARRGPRVRPLSVLRCGSGPAPAARASRTSHEGVVMGIGLGILLLVLGLILLFAIRSSPTPSTRSSPPPRSAGSW